jgi:hypothetical protein
MEDLVAAERSDVAVVLPELAARERPTQVIALVLMAFFAVALIIGRPF